MAVVPVPIGSIDGILSEPMAQPPPVAMALSTFLGAAIAEVAIVYDKTRLSKELSEGKKVVICASDTHRACYISKGWAEQIKDQGLIAEWIHKKFEEQKRSTPVRVLWQCVACHASTNFDLESWHVETEDAYGYLTQNRYGTLVVHYRREHGAQALNQVQLPRKRSRDEAAAPESAAMTFGQLASFLGGLPAQVQFMPCAAASQVVYAANQVQAASSGFAQQQVAALSDWTATGSADGNAVAAAQITVRLDDPLVVESTQSDYTAAQVNPPDAQQKEASKTEMANLAQLVREYLGSAPPPEHPPKPLETCMLGLCSDHLKKLDGSVSPTTNELLQGYNELLKRQQHAQPAQAVAQPAPSEAVGIDPQLVILLHTILWVLNVFECFVCEGTSASCASRASPCTKRCRKPFRQAEASRACDCTRITQADPSGRRICASRLFAQAEAR